MPTVRFEIKAPKRAVSVLRKKDRVKNDPEGPLQRRILPNPLPAKPLAAIRSSPFSMGGRSPHEESLAGPQKQKAFQAFPDFLHFQNSENPAPNFPQFGPLFSFHGCLLISPFIFPGLNVIFDTTFPPQ